MQISGESDFAKIESVIFKTIAHTTPYKALLEVSIT